MVIDSRIPRPKCYLNADALIANLKDRFRDVTDHRRQASSDYSMTDTLTAALAMFSLKELQRGGMLKKWEFDDGHYLLSIDGNCLERKIGGKTQYHQQGMTGDRIASRKHDEAAPKQSSPLK